MGMRAVLSEVDVQVTGFVIARYQLGGPPVFFARRFQQSVVSCHDTGRIRGPVKSQENGSGEMQYVGLELRDCTHDAQEFVTTFGVQSSDDSP